MQALTLHGQGLPPLEDLDDKSFDPFENEELSLSDTPDPYPLIRKLAAENWVHEGSFRRLWTDRPHMQLDQYSGQPHFMVFGYAKCNECLPQAEIFTNRSMHLLLKDSFGQTLTAMDAPEHPRYRRIFQQVFLPQKVRKWGEPVVDPIVTKLVSDIKLKGRADLVKDFTFHFPFQVIYRQLDLPEEDIHTFHKLAVAQTTFIYAPDKSREASAKLGVYFRAMIRQRRENPGDDMVSALATAEVDGEMLPENVVVSFLRQLVNAAGDTTYRGTSTLLHCLLANPEQLEAVRNDRALVGAAIEEALRWDGPVMSSQRVTSREVTIDGFTFPEGAWVDFILGSANRDPTRFVDPDKYDIHRTPRPRIMTFSTGPHVCIGQHLARVEMERALNSVLDHLPGLRLDPDMPPPQSRGYSLRRPDHIHVLFDA